MSSNAVLALVASQVATGQLNLAEKALMSIADTRGDLALKETVSEMPKADLLAIVREYDSGKPTAIAGVLTPEQVAELLEMELDYGEKSNRLASLMHALVLAEYPDAEKRIEAIFYRSGPGIFARFFRTEAQATFETLHEYFVTAEKEKERGARPLASSEAMMNDQSWQRLVWLLLQTEENVLQDVLRLMRTQAHEPPPPVEDPDETEEEDAEEEVVHPDDQPIDPNSAL